MILTEEAAHHLAGSTLVWFFLAAAVLIVLNGLFVAYEFAVMTARRATFEAAHMADRATSKAALKSMSDLSAQLAGAQLGITMASLALGYVGEPAFASVFEAIFDERLSPDVSRWASLIFALSVVVFLHLVVGEMVPKNIALAAPDHTLVWLVLPYKGYMWLVRPLVGALNGAANAGIRLFGVEPRDELQSVHTVSELAAIVSHSSEGGAIEADDAQLLAGALDFARRPVREVAVPLSEYEILHYGATVAQAQRIVQATGRKRIPIAGPSEPFDLLGYVHARDLLVVDPERRASPIQPEQIHRMTVVGGEQPLAEVLPLLRRFKLQLAVVVDNAEPTGIASMEDIIGAIMAAGEPRLDSVEQGAAE